MSLLEKIRATQYFGKVKELKNLMTSPDPELAEEDGCY